ncbi:MAG: HlyD family secretion protein [Amaricoccus sp.]
MFELLFCSMLTVLPDYLYRRFAQGKRIGREITLYTVWYELRWGITACLVLTVSLITLIFYFHPATRNVSFIFRTVTILPETPGRVAEVFVQTDQRVEAGQALFRLDSSQQQAAFDLARRQVAEAVAQTEVARAQLAGADGVIAQAEGAYQQALDELDVKVELQKRNPNVVAQREIDRLQVAVDARKGGVDAALASRESLQIQVDTLLPAQQASAEAALQQAQVALDKTTIHASVAGTVQQFALRPGDIVNPLIRSAGILVPDDRKQGLIAGFSQIEAQVLKPGMIGEITCAAKPFTIVPVVVTGVQPVIASGQFRPSDQLIDAGQLPQNGTLTVFMDSLYPGQLDDIPPGSSCIANAYTSNYDLLDAGGLSAPRWLFLHAVDAVGLVHAMLLRIQSIVLPFQTLVLGGH